MPILKISSGAFDSNNKNSVLYVEQELDAAQQEQARKNISAAKEEHNHGNISPEGKLGEESNQFVTTGTDGIIKTSTPEETKETLGINGLQQTLTDTNNQLEKLSEKIELIGGNANNYLPLTGGTLTGGLTINVGSGNFLTSSLASGGNCSFSIQSDSFTISYFKNSSTQNTFWFTKTGISLLQDSVDIAKNKTAQVLVTSRAVAKYFTKENLGFIITDTMPETFTEADEGKVYLIYE